VSKKVLTTQSSSKTGIVREMSRTVDRAFDVEALMWLTVEEWDCHKAERTSASKGMEIEMAK
jgi:hypothetical protein